MDNQIKREQWLETTIKSLSTGSKILDAGAGELKYKKYCSHLDYVSQDFGQYDGKGNANGLQTGTWDNSQLDIVSDITDIPVKDKSFDAVMCIEVFEHIPQPLKALEEFSRILKSGGKLILTAPVSSLTHFAPYYFSNGFSKYWYEYALEHNGFEIKELVFNGNYFDYLRQELKRLPAIEHQYTDLTLCKSFFARKALKYITGILSRLSNTDKGSNELLCLGIQVLAVKK